MCYTLKSQYPKDSAESQGFLVFATAAATITTATPLPSPSPKAITCVWWPDFLLAWHRQNPIYAKYSLCYFSKVILYTLLYTYVDGEREEESEIDMEGMCVSV